MERLTYDFCIGGNHCWQVKGADNLECREVCQCQEDKGCKDCPIAKAFDRLAAYEDTGLMPENVEALKLSAMGKAIAEITEFDGLPIDRLRELAEADKDGRLVVLPCKVGDVVYGFHGEKTILPMVAKWIETNTDGWCIAVQYAPMAPRFYQFSDFGKTVFLTREEAKKALEAMKDE